MTQNQLLTGGAIGFAAFALWYILRQPGGGAIASQPGQQQRDLALIGWFQNLSEQENAIANRALGDYNDELRRIGVL
jgi:hypothetical protein